MSHGEMKDGEEVNMAAWLVGVNTLKIQPFNLPSLGILSFSLFASCLLKFWIFISYQYFLVYLECFW